MAGALGENTAPFPWGTGSGTSAKGSSLEKSNFSTLEIAEWVCDELHSLSLIELNENPPPKNDFVFCIDRARELLNFQPSELNEAVRQYAKHRRGESREAMSDAKN